MDFSPDVWYTSPQQGGMTDGKAILRPQTAAPSVAVAADDPGTGGSGIYLWRFGPQRSYTARQLGLTDLQSPNDADGDGVDDWTDVVLGARAYIATDPHYQSKYYAGGIPMTDWGSAPTSSGRLFRRRAMT